MHLHAYVSPLFGQHEAPSGHPERQARYEAVLRGIAGSTVAASVVEREARAATESEVLRAHSEEHLANLGRTAGKRGQLDSDTYFSPQSYAAALHAAGAACQLVEDLLGGDAHYGIVACRPPGHHAGASEVMGFCLLNNVAIAARSAIALGAKRVAIVDWDVHHGNGTEAIFRDDPNVLFISTHESPQYPGTGPVSDVGGECARGKTVNVPLSSGAGDAVYGDVFEHVVSPILEQFAPDLTLVSAGYDAHERDPLGGMGITDAGYGHLTRHLISRLPNYGSGKLGFLLEGGYDLTALTHSVDATLSALASPEMPRYCGQPSAPWRLEIQRVVRAQSSYWELEPRY